MKIAVCFSGQIRTGVQASANLIRYIGELMPYCTFFCHTWNINTRKPLNCNGIYRPDYPLEDSTLEEFRNIYNLHGHIEVEDFYSIFQRLYITNSNWVPLHYSWHKSIKMAIEYQKKVFEPIGCKFDIVIKLRPDLIIRPNRTLALDLTNCFVKHDRNSFFNTTIDPGLHGIMDDVMYFAKPDVMLSAAEFSDEMLRTGIRGLHTHLQNRNINLANIGEGLRNDGYTILREESVHRNPIIEFEECFADDARLYLPLT